MTLDVPRVVQQMWTVNFRYADLSHHRGLLDPLATVAAVVQSIVAVDAQIYLE